MRADPVTGTPSVTCQMPDPSCASTPRTMLAIDGSTNTSRVPRAVFTSGKISGCASMPRASPITGMIVARVMPLVATDVCVSCISCEFQPLRELSADRVNQGCMGVCATELSPKPKRKATARRKRPQGFIYPSHAVPEDDARRVHHRSSGRGVDHFYRVSGDPGAKLG